ncbi:MAG: cell division protein FtsL [Gammaproteobacteria bacterium]|nr:cell division protein FtsL [Gammaproteobacteria bacterium]
MKTMVLLLLILAVFITGIKVVVTRHDARTLFVEIQRLEKIRDELNEEWGRLQLEQSTWATDVRVESMARSELGMKMPDENSLVLLQP